MDQAIKLAVEKSGYNPILYPEAAIRKVEADPVFPRTNLTFKDNHWDYIDNKDIVLDPLFWQALGKALEWGFVNSAGQRKDQFWINNEKNREKDWERQIKTPEWLYQALRYHELVLTGGDQEKFWKELLTSHQ